MRKHVFFAKGVISCSVFVFTTYTVQSLKALNQNFKTPAIFHDCTAWFVSNLVGTPEDRFSHDLSQLQNCYMPLHFFYLKQKESILSSSNLIKEGMSS